MFHCRTNWGYCFQAPGKKQVVKQNPHLQSKSGGLGRGVGTGLGEGGGGCPTVPSRHVTSDLKTCH